MAVDIDHTMTYTVRTVTDEAGRFHFPAQDSDFQLVITHPADFAHIKSPAEWKSMKIIRREPRARVEGTFRVGKTPAANAPIRLNVSRPDSFGAGQPQIRTQHETHTDPDGRFVFKRVIPGKGRIGRSVTLRVAEGATEVASSCQVSAEFPAGGRSTLSSAGLAAPSLADSCHPKGSVGRCAGTSR